MGAPYPGWKPLCTPLPRPALFPKENGRIWPAPTAGTPGPDATSGLTYCSLLKD